MTLLHAEQHERTTDAFAARKRIVGWSRAEKEAYIRGDFPKGRRLGEDGGAGADRARPAHRAR